MKILSVNTSDINGGAAKAAYRLLLALRQADVEASLLVRNKRSQNQYVVSGEGERLGWCKAYLDFLPLKLYPRRLTNTFSRAAVKDGLQRWVTRLQPDLLHLHWVNEGFLQIETLRSLGVPLVWTMHDSWAFTGGCHLPADCRRYEERCGCCPVLGSAREDDLSRRVWNRKQQSYPFSKMTFVAPSQWLAERARSSSLLSNCPVEVIPNPVDVTVYFPGDRLAARSVCGLPEDRHVLLFGAQHALSDPNKGAELLWKTLQSLPAEFRRKCLLVVFGEDREGFCPPVEIETINRGVLDNESEVVNLYRAADVLLLPSRQENLPNMISEAMSCGLPCVAFAVGGIPEQIRHHQNGCLVEPFDTEAMANEITGLFRIDEDRSAYGVKAREHVEQYYSMQVVARQYLSLYERIVNPVSHA